MSTELSVTRKISEYWTLPHFFIYQSPSFVIVGGGKTEGCNSYTEFNKRGCQVRP